MTDVVEYDQLVAFLKHASVFEIYRLSAAIQNELENPQRLAKVNHKIKEGDFIEYFDSKTNTLIKAIVVQKALKKVVVQHVDDGRRWQIPLYWLKIDSREFVFEQATRGLSKNAVKVGDFVGFYHQNFGEHIAGRVERLNQKTVSLLTPGKRWRVSYQLLYPIIDGEQIETLQRMEHQLDLNNFAE
jgi:hypothetical protein